MKKIISKAKTMAGEDLLATGVGILLFGIPPILLTDYGDFFRFLGVGFFLFGLIHFFFGSSFQKIFISEGEIRKLEASNRISVYQIPYPNISLSTIILLIIIGGFLINQVLVWKANSAGNLKKPFNITITLNRKLNK